MGVEYDIHNRVAKIRHETLAVLVLPISNGRAKTI